MPKRTPCNGFQAEKGSLKVERRILLDELGAAGRCWQRRKTARTGGELNLRGWIDPDWIHFEAQICQDVAEHDESTAICSFSSVLHSLESVVAVSSANDGVDTSLVALVIPTSCSRLIAALCSVTLLHR